MMKKLQILITSPPDRERCVAELWDDSEQVAEVYHEGEEVQIEIYSRAGKAPWRFPYDDFVEALASLKDQL